VKVEDFLPCRLPPPPDQGADFFEEIGPEFSKIPAPPPVQAFFIGQVDSPKIE
jgi:hypothetical protein